MPEPVVRPERSRGRRFIRSFVFAGRGLCKLVATEPNAQFHAVATVVIVTVGFWLGLTPIEWAIILVAAGVVWTAEGLNSAIESLADRVSPERHPLIERSKDIAAGAVLAAAIVAAIVGVLILGPKLLIKLGW